MLHPNQTVGSAQKNLAMSHESWCKLNSPASFLFSYDAQITTNNVTSFDAALAKWTRYRRIAWMQCRQPHDVMYSVVDKVTQWAIGHMHACRNNLTATLTRKQYNPAAIQIKLNSWLDKKAEQLTIKLATGSTGPYGTACRYGETALVG